MDDSPQLELWPTLSEGKATDFRVFSVRPVDRRSPRTGKVGRYQVIEAPNWVNVVALTPEQEVVLIEQFRHGIDDFTLEIPGGMIEAGEDPGAAGARELEEETGYIGEAPIFLGNVHPNPAIQNNVCATYLIENARPVGEMALDDGEDIRVVLEPVAAIPGLLREERITHSLVIAAFHWLSLRQTGANQTGLHRTGLHQTGLHQADLHRTGSATENSARKREGRRRQDRRQPKVGEEG